MSNDAGVAFYYCPYVPLMSTGLSSESQKFYFKKISHNRWRVKNYCFSILKKLLENTKVQYNQVTIENYTFISFISEEEQNYFILACSEDIYFV